VGRRLPTDGILLPPVDRVIGPEEIVADTNTRDGVISAHGPIRGVRWADHYGFARMSAFDY
jgi:hypothetical protein